MAKPISRLRTIAENKDVHSYVDLYNYVHQYCGQTLMNAVVEYRYQMELFFDARNAANQCAGMQKQSERTTKSKRGITGCAMTIERRNRG